MDVDVVILGGWIIERLEAVEAIKHGFNRDKSSMNADIVDKVRTKF